MFTLQCIFPLLSLSLSLTYTHTHTHTYIQSLPGRPPQLTGLVNHLHNINGETFVTSNACLSQHLFNCPQPARHSGAHIVSGEGSGGEILKRMIKLPIPLLARWDVI